MILGIPPGISSAQSASVRFAIDSIHEACDLALRIQSQGAVWSGQKVDGSVVTEVDYSAQAAIARRVQSHFSGDALVAEEDVAFLKSNPPLASRILSNLLSIVPDADEAKVVRWIEKGEGTPEGRYWLLDPIDSTKGLLSGGLYCINLALVEDGRVALAAIGVPKPFFPWFAVPQADSGYLYVAARAGGAWWTMLDGSTPFVRLQVSSQPDVSKAVRLRSLSKRHTDQSDEDFERRSKVSQAFGEEGGHIRCPAPMRYPLLASGQSDLYVHLDLSGGLPKEAQLPRGLKAWDHAAGSLLVEEAGGQVTDLTGRPLDFAAGRVLSNNRGLLASNGLLHQQALDILKSIGEGEP